MNQVLILLLAAGEAPSDAGERAANNWAVEWQGMVVAGVTALLVMLALWFAKRWRTVRAKQLNSCPLHLLQELCSKHGLARSDQRLLAGLAREERLDHPAMLFVDPRLWEPSRMGSFGKRYAAPLDRLRERILDTAS